MLKLISQCLLVLVLLADFAVAKEFHWSGYQWRTRPTSDRTMGPGKNLWSDEEQNIFIDDDGNLHLKITQNAAGKWVCAEVMLVESLTYGTYEFELSSRYDTLAKNSVVGLFTYISPASVARKTGGIIGNDVPDTPHEIDIEMTGAWGDANLFFTTHDPDVQSPSHGFYQPLSGNETTHRFTWRPREIRWSSFHGHVAGQANPPDPIIEQRSNENHEKPASVQYTGPVIPKDLDEKLMINFWIFNETKPEPVPSDGKEQELIVHSFRFTPLAD
ncbi:glycoside hydrolase family 16 protein [Rubripirellula amarantea]|nr:glycoside hydrolase family 16 protein [Rubripirellula amarantea]